MRNRWILITVIAGMVAFSGAAWAAETDGEDTVFNFGYDEQNGVFLWNQSPNDGVYDCSLANGTLNTTYSLTDDGLVVVDGLTDDSGTTVSFDPTPEEDLADGLELSDEPFEYAGADGECGVSGGLVAGANGQINHGMFMKLFNSLFDGKGRGCLNRHLAKSRLGKDDQHLRVGDVDPDSEEIVDGDTGMVIFETAAADCFKEDRVAGRDKGAEKHSAKEDKQRGKSDQAPGRNK